MKSFAKTVSLIAVLAFVLPISVSAKEIAAPFGLTWGQSKADLESVGVEFHSCKSIKVFLSCRTKSPPKAVSFSDFYQMFFHTDTGLQKVTMYGENTTNDITGSDGKKLFAKVKSSLTRKYGQPSFAKEGVGAKLYDEYDEFYQCLAYSGCGVWFSAWESSVGGALVLQLRGVSRGKGFLQMVYESGAWSKTLDDIKSQEAATDEDAF